MRQLCAAFDLQASVVTGREVFIYFVV